MMLLSEWLNENENLFESLQLPDTVDHTELYLYLMMNQGNRIMRDHMIEYDPKDVFVYINLRFRDFWVDSVESKLRLGVAELERMNVDQNVLAKGSDQLDHTKLEGAMNTVDFIPNEKESQAKKHDKNTDLTRMSERELIRSSNLTRQEGGEYAIINSIAKDIAGLIGKRIY